MSQQKDYLIWLRSQSDADLMAAIRSEVLDCNQTTRLNASYIINVLESPHADMRLVQEYIERIRATADRLTILMNAATTVYDERVG